MLDEMAAKIDPHLAIAKSNMVENEELFYAEGLDGLGFPVIKAYTDGGESIFYKDVREVDTLIKWMQSLSTPVVTTITGTESDFEEFKMAYLTDRRPVLVYARPAATAATMDKKVSFHFFYRRILLFCRCLYFLSSGLEAVVQ
jgi:hypothetical protein